MRLTRTFTETERKLFEEEVKDERMEKYIEKDNVNRMQIIDKLGRLEDIEDELGIDLTTLFKARNCIFRIYETSNYKGKEEIKICETRYPQIDILRKTICTFYKFEDYGKTWALTKEELEK